MAAPTFDEHLNAFAGSERAPEERELREVLGTASALWNRMVDELAAGCRTDDAAWGSSSRKAGWSLRMSRRGRVIAYVAPGRGRLVVSFALGQAAMTCARASGLRPATLALLEGAKRYAEGYAVRVPVAEAADVADVVKIAVAKVNN